MIKVDRVIAHTLVGTEERRLMAGLEASARKVEGHECMSIDLMKNYDRCDYCLDKDLVDCYFVYLYEYGV